MITKLSEEEIINYLLTSEFNDGLTPDEFRFLLINFRNFFRVQVGKNDRLTNELIYSKKEKQDIIIEKNKLIDKILSEKAVIEDQFNFIKSRNLSWLERIKGKIIIKDENI